MNTEMKFIVVFTACLIAFFLAIGLLIDIGRGAHEETQAEMVAKAARSCPAGLQYVKFHNDGTETNERVVCK